MRRHIQIGVAPLLMIFSIFIFLSVVFAFSHTRPHTFLFFDREHLKLRILYHGLRHSLRLVVVILRILQRRRRLNLILIIFVFVVEFHFEAGVLLLIVVPLIQIARVIEEPLEIDYEIDP